MKLLTNSNLVNSKIWSTSFRLGLYELLMPINYDHSLKEAFQSLKKKKRILDLGCGSGRMLFHAKTWFNHEHELVGIDIDPFAIQKCKERASVLKIEKKCQFLNFDMTNLDELTIGKFEGILSHFSLYTIHLKLRTLLQISTGIYIGPDAISQAFLL